MAYNSKNDKMLKHIGTIVLQDDDVKFQAIHVRIMKYGHGMPKVAITCEQTSYNGETAKDTVTTSKIPRFIGEDMEKIVKKLPKLLEKAYDYLRFPPEPKKKARKKTK